MFDGNVWATSVILMIGLVVIGVAYVGITWEVLKRTRRGDA